MRLDTIPIVAGADEKMVKMSNFFELNKQLVLSKFGGLHACSFGNVEGGKYSVEGGKVWNIATVSDLKHIFLSWEWKKKKWRETRW